MTLCAVVALSSAGLLPAAVQYSPASAVSSQSIVSHSQPALATKILATPVAKYAVAAPLAYSSPAHYSSAAAVSSQNIVRHDESARLLSSGPRLALSAPLSYAAAPASLSYQAAPRLSYAAAPAQLAYHAAPVTKILAQPEQIVSILRSLVAYYNFNLFIAYHCCLLYQSLNKFKATAKAHQYPSPHEIS